MRPQISRGRCGVCIRRLGERNPVLNVTCSVVSNANPMISDPLATLANVAASMKTVVVEPAHPLGGLVDEMAVPHHCFAFLWFDDHVGLVAVLRQVAHVVAVTYPHLKSGFESRVRRKRANKKIQLQGIIIIIK